MLKKLGERIFRFYCHPDLQEDILGDLEEYYEQNCTDKGQNRAGLKFFIDTILLFRLSLLKEKLSYHKIIYTAMLQNIFKTAIRVFWRERGYSLMNILGLTTGIAASMLLFLYVQSERSVNQFHKDLDQIHKVMIHQKFSGGIATFDEVPGPLVTVFKDEMPEVESMATFTWPEEMLLSLEDQNHKAEGRWASEDFFQIFDVKFIEGDKENSLSSPTEVFISESLKERIFGNEKALSKQIEINGWGEFQVGGVFQDVPNESTIKFDFMVPYKRWNEINTWVEDWGNSGTKGIAKLAEGTNLKAFNKKIEDYMYTKQSREEVISTIFLQPLKEHHLYSKYEDGKLVGGKITYIKLFSAIAIFILLIAVINFVNLATARSAKRSKEVGVKKVVGSTRAQLQFQFMIESILIALISSLLSAILIVIVLDPLNNIIGKEISFSLLELNNWGTLLGIGLSVGFLAGIYPSFILSNLKVLTVLKGSQNNSKWSSTTRKGLVIFQFTISTVLIISTLIIRSQLDYVKSKNLGYIKEHLITVPVEGELWNTTVRDQLKTSLIANPNFTDLSFSSGSPLSISNSTSQGFSWEGKEGNFDNLFAVIRTDANFIDTYGMEMVEGRNFNAELATDTMNVIINEQTAKIMGLEDPLTVPITFWNRTGRVVGVVKDFHFSSLHDEIKPLVIANRPRSSNTITIKMTGQNIAESVSSLEKILSELNPNYPFEFQFVDDNYNLLYQSESTVGVITEYFSGIAIFISLLGLFGLSSFAAEQRIKEIGVRKVLGANILSLILLMSKGFLYLVGIGFLLAVPVGYSLMSNWLETFEYRVQVGISVFLIAAILSLLITILTVSYHALKAAYANPVKSLRYE